MMTINFSFFNDFFQADLNSFQKGRVSFQLPELKPGPHHLKVKAWDVLNNSSEAILELLSESDEELQITHVLNYPNPFTTRTQFWFEHNKPGLDLQLGTNIYGSQKGNKNRSKDNKHHRKSFK
jgi:hypothetical protein